MPTVEEIKNYLRVDYADDDALLADMLTAAKKRVNHFFYVVTLPLTKHHSILKVA